MAGNITPTNQFAAQAGPIPLSQLDTNFNQAASSLNSLSTFSNFYQDTGTTNAWVVTINSPQAVAYTVGLNLSVKVANNVTGAVTINVNGLGAKAVTNPDTTAITSGSIVAGAIVDIFYDGTQFQCNGGTQGSAGNVPTSRQILTTAPLTGGGDLTANRTLAVNTFGAAQSGVVPSSGGGTTTFLRADGTWASPVGSGGTVTSIATTAPITGGTITTTGTIGVSTFGAGNSGVVPASGGGTANFLRADGNWTAPFGAPVTLVRTSDASKSSTTTKTNDTILAYSVPSSGTYSFYVFALLDTGGVAAGGFATNLNYSGSFTTPGSVTGIQGYDAGVPGNISSIPQAVSATTVANAYATAATLNASTSFLVLTGTLIATGTGVLGFAWAQNSSNGNAAFLRAGSYMVVTRLA